MVSPVEHQMTVESPTNGQPPAAAAAANSAERDSLPQLSNGRWITSEPTERPSDPYRDAHAHMSGDRAHPRLDRCRIGHHTHGLTAVSWTEIKVAAVRE